MESLNLLIKIQSLVEKVIDTEQNIIQTKGGFVQLDKYITMNSKPIYGTFMNLLHEIFHTLGLNHPKGQGADSGIMAYPPQNPNQKDINILCNGKFLPLIIE